MTPVLVFDIETVPDVAGLRAVLARPADEPDEAVAEAAFALRRAKTGSDFLALHVQRIVAVACLMRDADGVRVRSLGAPGDDEARLVRHFFGIVERHTPQLVSWNGSGFDLQVLHYRAMVHGVQAPRYWDQGEADREFRFNNYLNRYHARHTDLMDVLALHAGRASAPLDELARLCGFPGKLGMDGSQVWGAFRAGRLPEIRAYCETDVANTFLVWCRFQLMRGALSPRAYRDEIDRVRATLEALPGEHWRAFLRAWPQAHETPARDAPADAPCTGVPAGAPRVDVSAGESCVEVCVEVPAGAARAGAPGVAACADAPVGGPFADPAPVAGAA